jgi:cytidylate kinase
MEDRRMSEQNLNSGSGSGSSDMATVVVAVDGPAGSGKSSVSKATARRLGYSYLDTGAAYRALSWFVVQRKFDPTDAGAVIDALPDFDYRIGTDPDGYHVSVGSHDVTEAIREPEVTAAVSAIARVPEVRTHLTGLFRDIMRHTERPGIVVEGRDITTVAAHVGEQLHRRDRADSRVVDFMNAADGVTTVDSTELDFDQTVDAVIAVVQKETHV